MWGLIGSLLGGLGGMGGAGGILGGLGGAGGAAGGAGGLVGNLMGGAGKTGGLGAYGYGPNGADGSQVPGLQGNPFAQMAGGMPSLGGGSGGGGSTTSFGGNEMPDYSFHSQNALTTGLVNPGYKDVSQNPWGMLGQLMSMGR